MDSSQTSIYQFSDYRAYLKAAGPDQLKGEERRFTLNKWAKKLGYRSQRSVGMVLSGFRVPSARMVSRISQVFEHDTQEHRYFELLVEAERLRKRGLPADEVMARLEELRPKARRFRNMEERAFAYVADWYHFVIRQMTRCRGFLPNPTAISRKLGGKVTPETVRSALRRMTELGLLERCEGQRQLTRAKGHIFSQTHLPNAARRQHHSQMMDRAKEALEEVEMELRDISSLTLTMHENRLPEAKEMIAKFRNEFDAAFDTDDADGVFQLNVQLFPHTRERGGST